jgi:hypothetical protein
MSMLYSLGNHNFAFSVEWGDVGHLAEVKAHRIDYFIRGERTRIVLSAFPVILVPSVRSYCLAIKILFAIDHLDAGRTKKGKDTIQLIRGVNPFDESVVDFVIEKITPLFS